MKKILIVFLVLFLLAGCNFTGMFSAEKKYELTETDIVSMMRNEEVFTSDQITVMGVEFGDSENKVKKGLGNPNVRNIDYEIEGIINLEYGDSLGFNGTGLIFHLEDNKVTRITVLEPFNDNLIGLTKLGKPKEEVYAYLGKPDNIKRMVRGPRVEFKTFVYNNGVEIILKDGKEDRLSFVKQST